jgi:hypothetical protein
MKKRLQDFVEGVQNAVMLSPDRCRKASVRSASDIEVKYHSLTATKGSDCANPTSIPSRYLSMVAYEGGGVSDNLLVPGKYSLCLVPTILLDPNSQKEAHNRALAIVLPLKKTPHSR